MYHKGDNMVAVYKAVTVKSGNNTNFFIMWTKMYCLLGIGE